MRRLAMVVAAAVVAPWLAGCLAVTGAKVAMNLAKDDGNLVVYLDGQEGKTNLLKKGATGSAKLEIKAPVSTSPTFRFALEKADKPGFIKMTSLSIYQKFEADYSNLAEYTIVARDTNDPAAQMKPGVDYSLGGPGAGFKVIDKTTNEVSGVSLKPGMKYMLTFTLVADRSETVQIYFETK